MAMLFLIAILVMAAIAALIVGIVFLVLCLTKDKTETKSVANTNKMDDSEKEEDSK